MRGNIGCFTLRATVMLGTNSEQIANALLERLYRPNFADGRNHSGNHTATFVLELTKASFFLVSS
jgi:hypothetical protein